MKPKVFISYAKENISSARRIYHFLFINEFNPWMDEYDLLPGQMWELEIEKSIRNADCVIVCLSSQSVSKRGYVQRELKFAQKIFDQIPEGKIYLIPIRLDVCNVPYSLQNVQWLDWFKEGAERKLLNSLKFLRPPQNVPAKTEIDDEEFRLRQALCDNIFKERGIAEVVSRLDIYSKVKLIYIYKLRIERWNPPGRYWSKPLLYTNLEYVTRQGIRDTITLDTYSGDMYQDLQKKYGLGDDTHPVRDVFLHALEILDDEDRFEVFDAITLLDAVDWHSPD